MIRVYDQLPDSAKMIREEVFMQEQGFKNEFDDLDNLSKHIILELEGSPVGTCRFYREDKTTTFIIGRVAVRKAYRAMHFGSMLIEAAEKEAKKMGASRMILHAQCSAEPFYSQLGYRAFGALDEDEGCPHVWMEKFL